MPAGQLREVDTGLQLSIRPGAALLFYGTEVNERRNLHISPLVVDHDYKNKIKLIVTNSSDSDIRIQQGQNIAKSVCLPLQEAAFIMDAVSV